MAGQTAGANTFRVFISSTFQDFTAERNALQARVWPKLQALCMRHGARFQAVDLRWGVSEEASREQQIMQICLGEIQRCQDITPRPNFIVLMGDRYGWRPVPEIVPGDEFDALTEHLPPEERALLEQWYSRDENAVPPEYCLLPRRGLSYDGWTGIEDRLHAALLTGARAAQLGEEAMLKFERSATEQEIIAGALQADPRNAFAYLRRIEDLPEDERAAELIDLEGGARDAGAKCLLEKLEGRLWGHLPPEQRHEVKTRWFDGALSDEHLDRLCEMVYSDLERVILEQITERNIVKPLDQEIAQHREFAEDRKRHFVGRGDMIARIVDYVEGGGAHPLVVHGRSGSGKSALLARVLDDLPGDATIITRFIGASPASTQLHSFLLNLCEQISRDFDLAALEQQWQPTRSEGEAGDASEGGAQPQNPYQVPGDPELLRKAFERFLGFVPEDRRLVIVLDALDQLSPADGAHALNWLPRELPPNVRLVASVLEREDAAGQCLRSARHRLPQEALVPLPELSLEVCEQALDRWLIEQGAPGGGAGAIRPRKLTPEQRSHLGANLRACEEGRALYVRLAFEEARLWRSFDPLPRGADDVPGLSPTVEGIIADMLARLEVPARHGPVLMRAALGSLAAARNGLADDEMLHVLTANDDVWAWVMAGARHDLIERRLPPIIWSRLYFDLRPYLTERGADGTSLLGFYHRQVGEVVQARYLGSETNRRRAHRGLGDYFAAQEPWADAEARAANLRRASELAWQQARARDWEGLEVTLTDLQTLEAKAEGGIVFDLAADLTAARQVLPSDRPWSRNMRLLDQALRSDLHFIARHPTTLFQCFWNSAWWYDCPQGANHYDPPEGGWGPQGPPWERPEPRLCTLLAHWREEKEARQPGFVWLRSLRPPAGALGGAQIACLRGHEDYVHSVSSDPAGGRIASGSEDATIRVWDTATGEQLACLRGHEFAVFSVSWDPAGGRIASGGDDNTVRVWDAATGEELVCMPGHEFHVFSVSWDPAGGRIASGGDDNTVRVWDAATGQELVCISGHEDMVPSVAWDSAGGRIASASGDGTVRVWDAATGQELACLRGHEGGVGSLAWDPAGERIVSGSWDETIRVWDAATREHLGYLRGHEDDVRSVAWDPAGNRIVSGSWDSTVRVWDADTGEELACMRGHEDWVNSVAWDPAGKRIVSGSSDETVRVWDMATGEELACVRGHERPVDSVAWDPAGKRIVSGSSDQTVRVWDADTGEELACMRGHRGSVESVAWDPAGGRVVSGSSDTTVRVWDADTGEELACMRGHEQHVNRVAWDPEEGHIFSASGDGRVRVWDGQSFQCIAHVVTDLAVAGNGPFLLLTRALDTVIEDAVTRVALAWNPLEIWEVAGSPSRYTWAGGLLRGRYLAIIALEGNPTVPSVNSH